MALWMIVVPLLDRRHSIFDLPPSIIQLMQPDDDICYCYHVSMRKLVNFARRVRPVHASRMTECLGAGTGCGWCIPFLTKIANDPDHFGIDELTSERYAESRKNYIKTQPRNTFDGSAAEKLTDEEARVRLEDIDKNPSGGNPGTLERP